MKGRSLRLSSLSSPSIASPNSASQYVCLHCRHRASSIRQTAVSPTLSSIPFNRRSYATEPSIPDKFQAYFNKTIGKRLFKDGKIPGTVDETDQPDDKPAGPPGVEKTTTDLLDDDPDYKPATSGEGMEAVGGPTGWWEKTWDEEHQFQGYSNPNYPSFKVLVTDTATIQMDASDTYDRPCGNTEGSRARPGGVVYRREGQHRISRVCWGGEKLMGKQSIVGVACHGKLQAMAK